MNDIIAAHLRARKIDSFQKLRFLLFLHQYPDTRGTIQDFASWLYLGDTRLLEKIISDLRDAGLVDFTQDRCRLHDEPDVRLCLQSLASEFENPSARQEMLDQIRYKKSVSCYQESIYSYPGQNI